MIPKDKNIRVVPDTLNGLIVAVAKGNYRIPQFQREYVWEKSKVIELFDSIYNEFPIGSFFLWKADRQYNHLFRHSSDLNIRPIADDDDISFILDGQQRITSLFVTLMGLTARNTNYGSICFDVKEEKFTHRPPESTRYIRVCDIWGKNILQISREVDSSHHEALGRCYETLRTYPISIVEVRDKDLPAVCKIFQRINQAGKRLGRFDLISAMTFAPDFDLREKFKKDINAHLVQKAFGEIKPTVVTQLMALIKKGACTENVEYSLTASEIREMWSTVVDSLMLAADTLRKAVGVQNIAYLPYDAMLTLLAYYFAKSGQRSLSEDGLSWVKMWFWRASFSQHYGSGGPTKMGRDKALFDALMDGKQPSFNPAMNINAESLAATRMTWTGSAIRNAFLCLLAQRDPVHLVNNSRLDLVTGGISDFTNPQKHHIFPQAFLGPGNRQVHALPNFCFLPAELNRRILDEKPSVYFPELQAENAQFTSAAKTHLLPVSETSGIATNDYVQFLLTRSEMIIQEIDRLTGNSTAPLEEQRPQAVEKIESRLRDVIDATLLEAHGSNYWKETVPTDIRDEVEKKIENTLRKQPESKRETFASPREKLNFCNIPDYQKIICQKNNWPHFERTFRRPKDIERHLEAFSEFRNVIMHNRPMTELVRRGGELSLVWFGTVMDSENDQPSDTEQE